MNRQPHLNDLLAGRLGRFQVTRSIVLAVCLVTMFPSAGKVHAEEPAEAFVGALINEGYYDVALSYLDRIESDANVDADYRGSLALAKAEVHVAAAQTARTADDLLARLGEAEKALSGYIAQPDAPRRREALLRLASLQRVRADRMLADQPSDADRAAAREIYIASGKTFADITDSIRGDLQAMRGAKIDPSDRDAVARREQLRAEYLRGLVAKAETDKLAAETFVDPKTPAAKKLYQSASAQFAELAEKYSEFVPGATAKLSIGQIAQRLGDRDAAIAAYNEMLDAADADGLRDAKFGAAVGLLQLSEGQTPAEANAAIELASDLVDAIRPNERNNAAANQLQLQLAAALIRRSQRQGDDAKPSLRDGRKILNRIVKIAGPHVDAAKSMLADLGVTVEDPNDTVSAERPETTAAAVDQARQFLQLITAAQNDLAAIQGNGGEVDARRREIEDQIRTNRAVVVDLLRQGLALVDAQTDVTTILDARQLLAYALTTASRYRESIVVGQSLAELAPGTAAGLQGGLMALGSLQNLIAAAPSNQPLVDRLSSLADFLAATWPDDPKAQSAKSAVIQLALQNNDFDKATTLITAMDPSPIKSSLQLLSGRMQYADAVAAKQSGDSQTADTLASEAGESLRTGLAAVQPATVDQNVAKAALTLAKIQLSAGDAGAAVATLDHPVYGPTVLAKRLDFDPAFLNQLYSTEIRAVIGTMTGGGSRGADQSAAAMTRAVTIMDKLRNANQGDEGAGRLQMIYVVLAREIREEIEAASASDRPALVSAFRTFLREMSSTATEPTTLRWIAGTLLSLGEASMQPGQSTAVAEAAELIQTAVDTFDKLPDEEMTSEVLFQKARALRLIGQYKPSIDTFEQILKVKPTVLDAQIEAALAYEQYATRVPEKFTARVYQSALYGARPNGPKQQNTIWGWGKISTLTAGKPQFAEKFFSARYHLALCRFLQGKAEDSEAIMSKAVTDITSVASLYPDMGGTIQKRKFDDLLKTIQTELGRPAVGLGGG